MFSAAERAIRQCLYISTVKCTETSVHVANQRTARRSPSMALSMEASMKLLFTAAFQTATAAEVLLPVSTVHRHCAKNFA